MTHFIALCFQQPRCIDCDGWGPETLVPTFRTFFHYAGAVVTTISLLYAFARGKSESLRYAIPGAIGCAFGIAILFSSYRLSDKGLLLTLGIVYGSGLFGVVAWIVLRLARLLTRTLRRLAFSHVAHSSTRPRKDSL